MGTSISHRLPITARYGAFSAALGAALAGKIPTPRVVSELYYATTPTWQTELAGPALLPFVRAAIETYHSLQDRLFNDTEPAPVLNGIVQKARREAIRESGGTPAVAMGERALGRLLVLSTAGTGGLASTSPEAAAGTFALRRGATSDEFAIRLLGEVARQLALHVASRDLPRALTNIDSSVTTGRELLQEVSNRAAEAAIAATAGVRFQSERLEEDWSTAVRRIFAGGAKLSPGPEDGAGA
jgi:hypothetical protein